MEQYGMEFGRSAGILPPSGRAGGPERPDCPAEGDSEGKRQHSGGDSGKNRGILWDSGAAGAGADPTDSQSAAVRGTLHGAVRRAELRQSRVSGGLRRKKRAQGCDRETGGLYASVRKRPQSPLGRQGVPPGGQGPDSAPDGTKIRLLCPR